jgi:pimeloyl-ACP methyl ester carboxylesterase
MILTGSEAILQRPSGISSVCIFPEGFTRVDQAVEELKRCKPEVLYGDFLACDQFDLSNEVEKIDLPTLVICGNEDELTPVKYSQFLHSRIEGSRLEIVPEAGHMVMMEAPEAFNEKVGEFIRNPL